jgi:hypothetical protein
MGIYGRIILEKNSRNYYVESLSFMSNIYGHMLKYMIVPQIQSSSWIGSIYCGYDGLQLIKDKNVVWNMYYDNNGIEYCKNEGIKIYYSDGNPRISDFTPYFQIIDGYFPTPQDFLNLDQIKKFLDYYSNKQDNIEDSINTGYNKRVEKFLKNQRRKKKY